MHTECTLTPTNLTEAMVMKPPPVRTHRYEHTLERLATDALASTTTTTAMAVTPPPVHNHQHEHVISADCS